jgi:membrane-associated protein
MGRYPSPVHQHLALLSSISPQHLLSTFGVIGVLVVIFLNMGVLVFFFLPGDSLLFVAGYATVTDNSLGFHLPLGWLMIAAAVGAILGGQLGYEVGRRAGPALHERPDSRFYKKSYTERAETFVVRFGEPRAVVLSRFLPVVRTFTSPLVGVAGMPARPYASWNLISGLAWTIPIIALGHFLGHITFIRRYVEVLAILVIVASVVPALIHMARHRA